MGQLSPTQDSALAEILQISKLCSSFNWRKLERAEKDDLIVEEAENKG